MLHVSVFHKTIIRHEHKTISGTKSLLYTQTFLVNKGSEFNPKKACMKVGKVLQLIGFNTRTIFRKVRTETILKIHNTPVLPTFLYGSENWTLAALQRRRIEAAEMKSLRPLAGYTLCDHKTNDYIRSELRSTGILDKIDEYRRNWLLQLQRMPQNRIPLKSYRYRPQGRRTIGRPKKRWREQW